MRRKQGANTAPCFYASKRGMYSTSQVSTARRAEGWADLPWGGAGTGGFAATIPQSASLTAPFTQGSLRAANGRPYIRYRDRKL